MKIPFPMSISTAEPDQFEFDHYADCASISCPDYLCDCRDIEIDLRSDFADNLRKYGNEGLL